ncbi:MAG: flavin monoamine oxidase family protein [Bradymonadia bacterium]
MGRTSLFRQVRHWFELARLAETRGWTAEEVIAARDAHRAVSRREMLQGVAGVLAVSAVVPALAGCGKDSDADAADAGGGGAGGGAGGEAGGAGGGGGSGGSRVAIIGAGIGGLHCAYRLREAGLTPSIYDAWNRVGGRIFSLRGEYPEGLVAELGGELIDTGHVTMHTLAEEFDIPLDDLFADEPPGLIRDSWYFGGRFLTEVEVVEAFQTVAGKMLSTILTVEPEDGPYNDNEFARIDAMSLRTYLDMEIRAPEPINRILTVAYTGEYGLELEEQSPWNLLWLIDAETPDPFRIFGDSDERFHTRGGNDLFIEKLAAGLAEPVKTEHRLTAIRKNADETFTLDFDNAGAPVQVEVDRVVFALPFNQLRKVTGLDAVLSAEKLEIVNGLGYGTNAKLMMGFGSRVWEVDHRRSGSMFSDTGGQTFWDSSRKQAGVNGILTNFVGGERGTAIGEGDAEAQAVAVVDELEPIFPGLRMRYTAGSARRMHWPTVPTVGGSYTCYLPGQAIWSGFEGEAEGSLHFCGEHTSVDAQGYMEGGAESGARVAGEILDALQVAQPAGLVAILGQLEQGLTARSPRRRALEPLRRMRMALRLR